MFYTMKTILLAVCLTGLLLAQRPKPTGDVRDYGAKGDGITDDTVAIQKAIDSLPARGGIVMFPPGTFKITRGIVIGNGSVLGPSKKNNISLVGAGIGGTDNESVIYDAATTIAWYGTDGGTMLTVQGPIGGVRLEGFRLDCRPPFTAYGTAAIALQVIHAFHSTFTRLQATYYSDIGFAVTAYPYVPGVALGATDNLWSQIHGVSGAGSTGMQIGAAEGPGNDVNQNTFTDVALFATGPNTIGFELRFCDNLSFFHVTATKVAVVVTVPVGDPVSPSSIWFYNSPLNGTALRGTWTGKHKIFFWPYPTGDGEPVPTAPIFAGMTTTGVRFGY